MSWVRLPEDAPMKKRYQYWSDQGLKWTDWFDWNGEKYPYQLGKKQKNEYKDE